MSLFFYTFVNQVFNFIISLKMKQLYRLVILFIVVFVGGIALHAQTITLPSSENWTSIEDVQFLADPNSDLKPEVVMSAAMASKFLPSSKAKSGFDPEIKTYWLRFSAQNNDGLDAKWLFDFESWSFVDFHVIEDNQIKKTLKTGHLLPYVERNYPVGNQNLILLPVPAKGSQQCLVRLQSKPDHTIIPANLEFKVGSQHFVDEENGKIRQIISFFLGILIVMFLYNFFVFWSTRNRSYLYYLGILGATIYMTLSNSGYAAPTFSFFTSFPLWRGMLEAIGSGFAAIMMILFTRSLLRTKETMPFWDKFLKVFAWVVVVLTIGNNINFDIFGPMIFLATFLLMGVFITIGIKAVLKKIPSGGYYLLAYTFTVAGIMVLISGLSGAIPKSNFVMHYAMPMGYSIEMVIYSLALANIINVLKKENEKNHEQIIHQLRENDELQTKVNRELEAKVVARTHEISAQRDIIEAEKEKSDDLLLNILPLATAEELKVKGSAATKYFERVSVMFTDFVDFSKISENMPPEKLIENLDTCFRAFDDIASKYGIEKIKTIGDSYMCADGIPNEDHTDPSNIILAGLEMQEFVANWNKEKRNSGEAEWRMRVGIHTGPIIAGVVGKKKFSYDIWGDTVNLAARMETSGEPSQVNISESTNQLITDQFKVMPRGKVKAKSRGMIEMFFVEKLDAS